ncbi:aminotransferase-like domain-containing protein [Calidifontibacter terrae]
MDLRLSGRRLAELLGPADVSGPRYLTIADGVRALVADGRVIDGTRLPSERELVGALQVSRTTITRAYGDLVESGFAQARHGSGTTVRVPGGPAVGGGEPLGPAGDPGTVPFDLTCASPTPVAGLRAAMEAAIDKLPRFAADAGYFAEGLPTLRELIAHRFVERGLPTTADQILVTGGAQAATALVMQGLLTRRSRVLMESPGYPNSAVAVGNAGHRPVGLPVGDGLDLDEVERLARRGGIDAMMVVADFHNPTGRLLPGADRARLCRLWSDHGVVGIVDETLCDTWLDVEPDVRPVASYGRDVVTIGSSSKTYWGGLRMGWIRTSARRVKMLATARRALDLSPSVIDQLVLAELIIAGAGLPPEVRERFRASRDLLLDFGRSLGWEAQTPAGGLSIWWSLPAPASPALVREAGRRGIALHAGSAFAVNGAGLDRHLRTPYALGPERMAEALPLLREAALAAGVA